MTVLKDKDERRKNPSSFFLQISFRFLCAFFLNQLPFARLPASAYLHLRFPTFEVFSAQLPRPWRGNPPCTALSLATHPLALR